MIVPNSSDEIVQFEQLIINLIADDYSVCDDFFSNNDIEGLRTNLLDLNQLGLLNLAKIGKIDHHENSLIRGDKTKWIELNSEDLFERVFMRKLDRLITYLNQTCFTALKNKEAHYAFYPVGSFYKQHLDQFKNESSRVFSLVLYLNKDWLDNDEGSLSFKDQHNCQINILPKGGRLVLFKSTELLHEVLPSNTRDRMSITCWLKN